MDQRESRGFAARYTEAWCSHNAEATPAFFAEDGSIAVDEGEPAVGRERSLNWFRVSMTPSRTRS